MQQDQAQRLKETREYLGLSQDFVAKQTGLSRLAVSSIENAKRRVEANELAALARLYRRPIGYFLDGTVEEPDDVRAIARAAKTLNERDREQVLRFAQFLRDFQREPPES